jgi:hypothetical protein
MLADSFRSKDSRRLDQTILALKRAILLATPNAQALKDWGPTPGRHATVNSEPPGVVGWSTGPFVGTFTLSTCPDSFRAALTSQRKLGTNLLHGPAVGMILTNGGA